jgi:N-acyl-D-aspartate/D-glutamate deacylase
LTKQTSQNLAASINSTRAFQILATGLVALVGAAVGDILFMPLLVATLSLGVLGVVLGLCLLAVKHCTQRHARQLDAEGRVREHEVSELLELQQRWRARKAELKQGLQQVLTIESLAGEP